MAKNDGATATAENETKDTVMVSIQVPTEFKSVLESAAKGQNVTVAKFVRALAAKEVGYDLSEFESRVRTRASKFASEEERERAKRENSEKRANTLRALMAKYKAGEITLDASDLEAAAAAKRERGSKEDGEEE